MTFFAGKCDFFIMMNNCYFAVELYLIYEYFYPVIGTLSVCM
jgi:hypothetical protein